LILGLFHVPRRKRTKNDFIEELLLIRRNCKAGVTITDKKKGVKTIEGIYVISEQHLNRLINKAHFM